MVQVVRVDAGTDGAEDEFKSFVSRMIINNNNNNNTHLPGKQRRY
jgi:hypothetical protein